jgi:hypothetical protein
LKKPRRKGWARSLARPVGVKGGPVLRTVADARVYILSLSEAEQNENRWQQAAKLLLEAFETGGVVEAATRQLEFPLLKGAKLVMR